MNYIIGFATKYYTLWSYEVQPQYRADSYGNHHKTGDKHIYNYLKNISTDLSKVKELFPNVFIDNDLRGTTSFTRDEYIPLPENIFWGGKYAGMLIDHILESDFNYCLWAVEKYHNKYIKSHHKYISYCEAIELKKIQEINSAQTVKAGDVIELEFISNGFNNFWSNGGKISYQEADWQDSQIYGNDACFTDAIFGNTNIRVLSIGIKEVSGLYPYTMPIINGKATKTKGKSITVNVLEVFNTANQNGIISQTIKIA